MSDFFTAFSATCSRWEADKQQASGSPPAGALRDGSGFPVLPLQAGFQSITGASTLIRLPDIKCRPQKELSHSSVLNFHLIFFSLFLFVWIVAPQEGKKSLQQARRLRSVETQLIYFWLLVSASCQLLGAAVKTDEGWKRWGPSGGLYQRLQQASDAALGSPPASRADALLIVPRYFVQSSKCCRTQAVWVNMTPPNLQSADALLRQRRRLSLQSRL